MKMIYLTFAAFFTTLLIINGCSESLSTPNAGLESEPPIDSLTQEFINDYDGYFSKAMDEYGSPGAAVVIVKDGRIIFKEGYGERVIGAGELVNAETLFRIGSLSKGMASILTAILIDKGYLSWNDPVQKFCPEFILRDKSQARRIEIRHLLSHTTGLPYQAYSNLIEQGFDLETIARQYFPVVKLTGKEGQVFGYQNAAFSIIEQVLQSATGKTFAELLSGYLFVPAGMKTSSCGYESIHHSPNKALPHSNTETGWVGDTIARRYYNVLAAGGVNASISDMGQWLLLLLGHKPEVVADNSLIEVFKPVFRTGTEKKVLPNWIDKDSASYALGWRILEKDGETLVYHSGFVNNYYSEIAFNRRDGVGICVLYNGQTQMVGECIVEFFERWKVWQNYNTADSLTQR